MPGGDGTGPGGMGPMTGRAAGYCAGYPVPGFMNPPFGGRAFWGSSPYYGPMAGMYGGSGYAPAYGAAPYGNMGGMYGGSGYAPAYGAAPYGNMGGMYGGSGYAPAYGGIRPVPVWPLWPAPVRFPLWDSVRPGLRSALFGAAGPLLPLWVTLFRGRVSVWGTL